MQGHRHGIWIVTTAVLLAVGVAPAAAADDVLITEIAASNSTVLADEDGQHPDWLEIFNAGAASVNLDGWFLTNDKLELKKWPFPALVLAPKEFRVIFASKKDRRNAAGELHTNFKLARAGGFVALVKPTREIAWAYDPYPEQTTDYTYGCAQNGLLERAVAADGPVRVLVPDDGTLGLTWTQPAFDDTAWRQGTGGVGYDRDTTFGVLIGVNVESEMYNRRTSAYIRCPFALTAPQAFDRLTLRVKYDDGFAAYLNGLKVAERNAPATLAWDSRATANHDDNLALVYEEFDVTSAAGALLQGANVLAIHGLNRTTGSSDFLIAVELEAGSSGQLDQSTILFFPQPTPGTSNVQGYPGVAPKPVADPPGGVFNGALAVALSAPGAEIRYTRDNTEPTGSSTLYTAPIQLTASALIRAKSFAPDLAPSPTASFGFIGLAADAVNFTSDIPVILIDNFGAGAVPADPLQPAYMAIFEPAAEGGRTSFAAGPNLQTRMGFKRRGSSTINDPKSSYTVETWDERNDDKDVPVLGMPPGSDWVLYGAYSFDLALMRNALIYELSNQVGRYAVRTRFCEVFVNRVGGSLAYGDYMGVYSFMERIKRGKERVNVERLTAGDTAVPAITGGYMLKVDRRDPGDAGLSAGGQPSLCYVYPDEQYIRGTPQAAWIKNYLDSFAAALNGANFRDPVLGYAPYVDQASWIDHHILNVLPMNVDALRLSTYFYKARGQPIESGPIWDFDRSMGPTDSRDDNPYAWNGTGDSSIYFTYDARYPWWSRLFADDDFMQLWKDRWFRFRQGPLSTANMHAVIDRFHAVIEEAATRNFTRWPLIRPNQFLAQINVLKTWLAQRAGWIDSQFLTPPAFSHAGGRITPPLALSMTAPQGAIYFTLNGSDPRGDNGAIAAGAIPYTTPIEIDINTRVTARAYVSASNWSAPMAATYLTVDPSRIVVSEIMYHPQDPPPSSPYSDDDFEFLEILNAESTPVDLSGYRFTDGIQYRFPEGTVIEPEERLVIVKNAAAFAERYGTAITPLGSYDGNLDNDGERLALEGALLEEIFVCTYDDAWDELTDGQGFSLVLIDPFDPLCRWSDPESWTRSDGLHGSPGEADTGIPLEGGWQRPGDANQDRRLDVSDVVALLRYLFAGTALPLPCEGESLRSGGNRLLLDLNGDAALDIADPVYLLAYLFGSGAPPALGTACVRIEGCRNVCW